MSEVKLTGEEVVLLSRCNQHPVKFKPEDLEAFRTLVVVEFLKGTWFDPEGNTVRICLHGKCFYYENHAEYESLEDCLLCQGLQ